jgi:pimeloyl-ACP methyl ester carboxylesterase
MRRHSLQPPPNPIPFDDFGGTGANFHFGHANGYPPGAYRQLLDPLTRAYHIVAMRMRPLWPDTLPSTITDWKPLADDLAVFLTQTDLCSHSDHCDLPLIGAGHSMGATTTLRLALRAPGYFTALVLIDPVLFPPRTIYAWKLASRMGFGRRVHPLIASALHRKRYFDNPQEMYENYRSKPIFRGIDDAGLHDYVESLARPLTDGRVELAYTPEWEAQIYATGILADLDIWRKLSHLRPPLLVIRGGESDTFRTETAQLIQRHLSAAEVQVVPGATHLVALEKPAEIAAIISDFLEKQLPPNSN